MDITNETDEIGVQLDLFSLRHTIIEMLSCLDQEQPTSGKQHKELIRDLQYKVKEYGDSFRDMGDFLTALDIYRLGVDVNFEVSNRYTPYCKINKRLLASIADCLFELGKLLQEENEIVGACIYFGDADVHYTRAMKIEADTKTMTSHATLYSRLILLFQADQTVRDHFVHRFHKLLESCPQIKSNEAVLKLIDSCGITHQEEVQVESMSHIPKSGRHKRKKKRKKRTKGPNSSPDTAHVTDALCSQTAQDVQWIENPKELQLALEISKCESAALKSSQCDIVTRLKENCSQFNLEFRGETPGDGDCFFHAVSDQLDLLGHQPQRSAVDLRQSIVAFMRVNPILQGPDDSVDLRHFQTNGTGWENYCDNMANGEWADHITTIAAAHMLQRNILIVTSSPQSRGSSAVNWIHIGSNQEPLRLGHLWEFHYQSLQRKDNCTTCDQKFPNQKELQNHIYSVDHRYKLYEDDKRLWNYRQPPISTSHLELCGSVQKGNEELCDFATIEPENNPCTKAHSDGELAEWKQRLKYRRDQMDTAAIGGLVPFMDMLLSKQHFSLSTNDTLSDSLPDVDVIMDFEPGILEKDVKQKRRICTWKICVCTSKEKPLQRAGLLYHANGRNVYLKPSASSSHVKLQALSEFQMEQCQDLTKYRFQVQFESAFGMFGGRLKQTVVFDFGSKKLLLRDLVVPPLPDEIQLDIPLSDGKRSRFVWDDITIIRFNEDCLRPARKYQLPQTDIKSMSVEDDDDDDQTIGQLTKTNYKRHMHKLLWLEEYRRTELIKRYCIKTKMHVIKSSENNRYLGVIDLSTDTLLDDCEALAIITSNDVTSVLVKFSTNVEKAYEAYTVPGKSIYVRNTYEKSLTVKLGQDCVAQEFSEQQESEFDREVEIKFEFQGRQFELLHHAVESMGEIQMGFLFPPTNNNPALTYPQSTDNIDDHLEVNKWQDAAIRYIVKGGGRDETPLLLIYGPFGTGKTHTLLTAIKRLLLRKETPSKILVCTHSNSAADVYIKKLHGFISKRRKEMYMRRLYPIGRDLDGVSDIVKKYIVKDVRRVGNGQLVITTNTTANRLAPALNGEFTHIFIDEAGQALEPETIIPLKLATSKTCVVLTGDHMQICPKVYSESARQLKFDSSLLQRVFEHCIKNRCERQILLRRNYRSRPEILAFTSKMFYEGIDIIEGDIKQPQPLFHHPLEFHSVRGTDQAYGESYMNLEEVRAVVVQVEELHRNWPNNWRDDHKRQEQIAVFCNYNEQVKRIRMALRERNLGKVVVERVRNVQGREFRAVFISTVRTRATLKPALQPVATSLTTSRQDNNVQFECGFFSDPKLLNTAITRAKSFIVVIGDPIVLCSLGSCQKVWGNYIRECDREGSLFPKEYRYKDIENDALAEMRDLRPLQLSKLNTKSRLHVVIRQESEDDISTRSVPKPNFNRSISHEPQRYVMSDESDSSFDDMVQDPILQSYQVSNDFGESESSSYVSWSSDVDDETASVGSEPLKISEEVEVDKTSSFATYDATEIYEEREHKPEYKICVLYIDAEGRWKAKTVRESDDDESAEVYVQRSHRGHALDGDTVRVELIHSGIDSEERESKDANLTVKLCGKIVEIIESQEREGKQIVCRLDHKNDNLMIPLDRRWPTMYLSDKRGVHKSGDENVPDRVSVSVHADGENRYEVISNKQRKNKLFLVEWRGWKRLTGRGRVLKVLPEGMTEESGIFGLKCIYDIGVDEPNANVDVGNLDSLLAEEIPRRINLSNRLFVFTIDTEEAQDLDDALSVEELPDGTFSVGVHITDVSFFVRPETDVDKEAYKRVTSVYSAFNKATHMLPLSVRKICSLDPGKDRLAISVFFSITKSGTITRYEFRRSVVQSKQRLTYSAADEKLNSPSDDTVDKSLKVLMELTTSLHLKRGKKSNVTARGIVEEMMSLVNVTVANTLSKIIPHKAALKKTPDITTNAKSSKVTTQKNRVLLENYSSVLRCIIDDAEGFIPKESSEMNQNFPVFIFRNKWDEMYKFVTKYSTKFEPADVSQLLLQILQNDENYTQVQSMESQPSNQKGELACSGKDLRKYHHSEFQNYPKCFEEEMMPVYTLFTSPIRKYFGILTHRQLFEQTGLYSSVSIERMCHHCNVVTARSSKYEQKTKELRLALEIQNNPLPASAVVTGFSETSMVLGFGQEKRIRGALTSIDVEFNILKPHDKPAMPKRLDKATLSWKERIYNTSRNGVATRNKLVLRNTSVLRMPFGKWQELISTLHTGNIEDVRRRIVELNKEYVNRESMPNEVSCETSNDTPPLHYANFERSFEFGDIAEIQLQAELSSGLLSPQLQLFKVSPKFHFCAEHRLRAVDCFSEGANRKPIRENIKIYIDTVLPILQMVAAYNAVHNNETYVIQDIKIDWKWHANLDGLHTGSFTLPYTFCNERYLGLVETTEKQFNLYYLCIHSKIRVPVHYMKPHTVVVKKEVPKKVKAKEERDMTMVFHSVVTDINVEKGIDERRDSITLCFKIAHCSTSFSRKIRNHLENEPCTVEVIPKTNPDRRLEEAVNNLHSADSLVRDICLKVNEDWWTKIPNPVDKSSFRMVNAEDVPGTPNSSQTEAIQTTLIHDFTVIQGPPGTGKTITGARIVHQFVCINKKRHDTGRGCPQVLYCGPSNKSVDVVVGYLKLIPGIKLVRVYGEHIEEHDFPTRILKPAGKMRSREIKTDEQHEDIALHKLIRNRNYSHLGEQVESFYYEIKKFIKEDKDPPSKLLAAYRKCVKEAKTKVLHGRNVVLCTCNVAGSPYIKDKTMTNIVQCVVDEAGMCNEPETLIPLVATKPEKIVLIGDHKQLRPIIQETTAKQLGMDISLLERYKTRAYMLKIQYRMHQGICEFPSKAFYDNELITDQSVIDRPQPRPKINWPGGQDHPIVFRHIIGEETMQSVHDEDGNEYTKANEQEAEEAVRIASVLVRKGVKETDIVMLTQYSLQRTILVRKLKDEDDKRHQDGRLRKENKLTKVAVRTVVLSQGSEWDYVILSTVRSLSRREIEETPSPGWLRKHLGFITDENQMNVALTRARRGLIIVGNQYLLSKHGKWGELIEHYKKPGCVVYAGKWP